MLEKLAELCCASHTGHFPPMGEGLIVAPDLGIQRSEGSPSPRALSREGRGE